MSIAGVALFLGASWANFQSGNAVLIGLLGFLGVLFVAIIALIFNVATDYLYVKSQNLQIVSAMDALKRGWKRGGTLLVAGILASLIVIGGLILLIIPGIYFALRLAYLGAVVANEDLGPIDSIKRAWELSKGHLWDIIGAALTVGSAILLANLILYGLTYTVAGAESTASWLWIADIIVSIISILLGSVLYFRYHQSDLAKAGILKKQGTDYLNYLIILPTFILMTILGAFTYSIESKDGSLPDNWLEMRNSIETESI